MPAHGEHTEFARITTRLRRVHRIGNEQGKNNLPNKTLTNNDLQAITLSAGNRMETRQSDKEPSLQDRLLEIVAASLSAAFFDFAFVL